ncbi:MAG: hypothetical protein WAL56_05925 [Candidatus Sulfotelmatobacter sp.]
MTWRRPNMITRVGLLALAAGLLLRLYTHAKYTEFSAGFLLGLSIVFMIAGFVLQKRNALK